jgi:hypothetical protein
MFKNVASQKITVYAYDSATGLPKTGDAAYISVYVRKDFGSTTQLGDTSATEDDATNAPGDYTFDLTQAETNANALTFSGKSSTPGIVVVPQFIYTTPPNFSTLSIDSSGYITNVLSAVLASTGLDNVLAKLGIFNTGTAQAGAASTITLAAGASATDDAYKYGVVMIVSGTGSAQAPREISGYVGSTKVATISPNWIVNPDNTSVYLVFANPPQSQVILPDVNVKTIAGTTQAVPGASGGILISGSNAGTTSLGALTVTGAFTATNASNSITGVSVVSNVKTNQALSNFEFPMTDVTNDNPMTGLTVGVTRSIDGAAFAAGTLSSVTEVGNGMYKVNFGSGDMNGKVITMRATATGANDLLVTIITDA